MILRFLLSLTSILLMIAAIGCSPQPLPTPHIAKTPEERIREAANHLASEKFDTFLFMTDNGMREYMCLWGNAFNLNGINHPNPGTKEYVRLMGEAAHFCQVYLNDDAFDKDRARRFVSDLKTGEEFFFPYETGFPDSSEIGTITINSETEATVEYEDASSEKVLLYFVFQDGKWLFDRYGGLTFSSLRESKAHSR